MRMSIAVAMIAWAGFGLAPGASQAANERLQRSPLDYELSLKGAPSGERAEIINATVNYSNTTVGGPTFTRQVGNCTGPSGTGVGVNYHVQAFSVDTTGAYDVTSVQDGGWDGYLFVYQNAFDPLNSGTNCVAGDDDGAGGIGTSDILGVALTAGTPYFVVTTGFDPAESGTFTNTIAGPGNISLGGGGGPQADLGLSKTAPGGVALGGPFVYNLAASNAGPDPATAVTVTDTLPAGVSFVSSNCGATEAGGTVTWTIGNLGNGAAASCDITVSVAGSVCPALSNTASISGAEADPVAANDSATSANFGNAVADPGFESGTPNVAWAESSTNFGTPICDAAGCGVGGGTGPHSGTYWTWFGGFGGGVESGSVSQSLVIPTGTAAITFWAEFPVCAANGASDFVRLTIDATEIWREDANSPRCNTVGYSQVTVPLGGFADGLSHTVSFESTTSGAGGPTNFFIDDVAVVAPPACSAITALPAVVVPSLNGLGLLGLGLMLGLGGLYLVRVRAMR